MWIMPLYLHVNQNSDYDMNRMIMIGVSKIVVLVAKKCRTRSGADLGLHCLNRPVCPNTRDE